MIVYILKMIIRSILESTKNIKCNLWKQKKQATKYKSIINP